MKVLFLTYDLPYPLISGGKIRAYHLIKGLSKKNKITLFSFYRDDEQRQYLPELEKYCQKIVLFKRRKAWSIMNFFYSLFFPFPAAGYYSFQLKKALKREASQYDLVHFESFYPALYLPLVKKLGVKTLMANENIESLVYRRYVYSRKFFLLRWLLGLEVSRMRLFEEKLWRKADANLALSPKESSMIKKITPQPVFIIPNGVDLEGFKETKIRSEGKNLIFIGDLIYQANQDAVRFFLEEIYPQIKNEVKEVKFILVSCHRPRWLEKYLIDSSIQLIQEKKTAYELLPQGDIFIAPIRIASGTNIKVLEAMAAGLPVVTTSVGIEGIEAEKGKEVIITNQPEEFASQVIKLLNAPERRERLSQAGRSLVERLYTWSKISKKLEKAYQELDET